MASDRNSPINKRNKYELYRTQLENEGVTFKPHWRELGDFINPRRTRFFVTDVNKGDKRNQRIIDSTATMASQTLRAGLMSGVTSPARPWFKLAVPDSKIMEVKAVKEWLHETSKRMSAVFLRSNLYNVLQTVYGDMGTFGTGAMFMEEDFENTVRFYPMPLGSFYIANNEKLLVRGFSRKFRLTVSQVVNKFGRKPNGDINWENISKNVENLYKNANTEAWVDIAHVIKENPDYKANSLESKYKRYVSVMYELGITGGAQGAQGYMGEESDDKVRYLSEKGYDFFPVLAPRWEVTGEDVYGTMCPGMAAIGDIKQLQIGERRSLQAIEKMINPPMTAPTALRNQKASILPGDITYTDERAGQAGFRPSHEVRFDINALEQKQEQVRGRIRSAFYADLFLMLSNSDRRQITAREIEERHEEKLLALGPVLERLNQDLLDPLIDNTFEIMLRQGQLPEPPEELQGGELKVEYISVMHQAQKLIGIGGLERFTQYSSNVAAVNPEVLDKINMDQLVDEYAEIVSIPPDIVKSDDEVQQVREARAQAQAKQQQAEQAQMMAGTAKDLSQADLENDSALGALLSQANAGNAVGGV